MKNLQYVYCLCCESAVPASDAMVIFQTGYYRGTIPLGCCQPCYQQGEKEKNYQYMGHLRHGYVTMRR
ncbi:hypothetical protein [Paenibacillus sp. FSL W8-0194]|uniref:hypothetical protein n=1 Tax=Paenibacillus sp. FSL W8-0194 TaxID=2921711 RepID=UPI0030D87A1A